MDDDECLSVARRKRRIRAELENPQAAIYEFARRGSTYLGATMNALITGQNTMSGLFRRGAITFCDTIHAGIIRHAIRAQLTRFTVEQGVEHPPSSPTPSVAGWIEKTNRYTANPNRDGHQARRRRAWQRSAHQRIDYWFGRTRRRGD